MRALILAGGRGQRLGALTAQLPKPLLPIGSRTPLWLMIQALTRVGFSDITLSLGHQADKIIAYIQGDSYLGKLAHYRFACEASPRGTAGPLVELSECTEPFLVCNADLITAIDFQALWQRHRAEDAAFTVATRAESLTIGYGVLDLSMEGAVIGYREKPQLTFAISLGIYVVGPSVPRYILHEEAIDIPQLLGRLLRAGERVVAFPSNAYWIDIGTKENYERARLDAAMGHGPAAQDCPVDA